MSASERDISACKCSPVLPTNARLAALLLAERSAAPTSSPTGSRVRPKRRVLTPASICSSATRVSGSRSAKCAYVASSISSSSTDRTRGRGTATRRPPKVTSPARVADKTTAVRSRSWRPFGPTTSVTSSSISVLNTPRPTPTLNASNPSFAAFTSSPNAACTLGGNPSSAFATCSCSTVLMAVLLVSMDLFALATVPAGPDEAGVTTSQLMTLHITWAWPTYCPADWPPGCPATRLRRG